MPKTQMGESVRQRILNAARETGADNAALLGRYATERLLYRVSQSVHRERFVLKGAALYPLWLQDSPTAQTRPTRDLDFWSSGAPNADQLVEVFREVLQIPVEPDGLDWPLENVKGAAMREDAQYPGARLDLLARLDNARIPVQIDFGFGDAITPPASWVDYPTLLATFPAPRLRAYPRETVVAEKFQALVALSKANTRLKDFFDLWTLSSFEFDEELLRQALHTTFARRQTDLPRQTPVALTAAFTRSPAKIAAWNSFGKRNRIQNLPELEAVAAQIEAFVMPILQLGNHYD